MGYSEVLQVSSIIRYCTQFLCEDRLYGKWDKRASLRHVSQCSHTCKTEFAIILCSSEEHLLHFFWEQITGGEVLHHKGHF